MKLSTVSIKTSDRNSSSVEISALEAKYGTVLDTLDIDGDGKIDRSELLMFVRDVAGKEKRLKYFKLALISTVALLILFALTTFGTVWAVVALTQKVESNDDFPGIGAALVSTDTGETLRTASGMLFLAPLVYNGSSISLYTNSTTSSRRRLLEGNVLTYIGEVQPVDVLEGCKLLLEGHDDIVTTIPVDESGGEEDLVFEVTVEKATIKACKEAIKSGDVTGLDGKLYLGSYSAEVKVICTNSDSCQVFEISSDPSSGSSPGQTPGRRLASSLSDGMVTLSFGRSGSLLCSAEQCSALTDSSAGELEKSGREL